MLAGNKNRLGSDQRVSDMTRRLKVTREQFAVQNNSVVHRPTGSWLVAYAAMPGFCRANIHGDVPDSLATFNPEEIREIGNQLLRERLLVAVEKMSTV
jgi:hypothetical protein